LDDLPRRVSRPLGWLAAAGTLVLAVLAVTIGDVSEQMGLNWPTAALAVLDGVIAVAWTLWCVSWFRQQWPTHGRLVGHAARASYATYVMHPLVLTAVMVLLAAAPLTPELKFLLVSLAAVPACFVVGYALIRAPFISKIL
jgi:peptidoglycan/LPS O-acetylase OafA/YrhL